MSLGTTTIRLAKYLAAAGIASRRASERLIAEGRVTVNDEQVLDPAYGVGETDQVKVDGSGVVERQETRVVYALNKPPGVVSTASDTHGRATVVELVKVPERVYPVGRLDAETTGLILLTNDGELAHRLTHPSFGVPKVYNVKVRNAPVRSPAIRDLRDGVELDDGRTAPAKVRQIAADELEITLREGRKRQIRRMCQTVGHPVVELKRIAFGPLRLGSLKLGDYRQLSPAEIERLKKASREKPTLTKGN